MPLPEPTLSPATCTRCVTVAGGTRYGCELHRPPPALQATPGEASPWLFVTVPPVLAPAPPGSPATGSLPLRTRQVIGAVAAAVERRRPPRPASTRGWAQAWEPAPDPTGCRGLDE